MNPPFRTYDGGKGGEGVWQRIISEMPPHRVYFEPFLGNSPIMARKASAALNIGYDLDASVVKAWRSSASESAIAPEASPFATNGDVTHYRFWCGDGIPALESREWSGEECVYADPPYLMDSRSCKDRMYKFEMGPDVHHRLLDVLLTLPCPVLLSSYDNPLYRSRLAGWRVVEIPTVNRRGKRTLELLWCNFTAPLALHDYRFLGRNFRERERITRLPNRTADSPEKAIAPELSRRSNHSAVHARSKGEVLIPFMRHQNKQVLVTPRQARRLPPAHVGNGEQSSFANGILP